nr:unnamed protein product [Callosobruchus analis]
MAVENTNHKIIDDPTCPVSSRCVSSGTNVETIALVVSSSSSAALDLLSFDLGLLSFFTFESLDEVDLLISLSVPKGFRESITIDRFKQLFTIIH